MNNAADQPLAGEFEMAPMPGEAHGTLGFAKFYAMTAQAAEDDARRDAAWKFIEYMGGGDYQVAKRWAVEKGLGFAALPLFDDPDVQEAWSSWIDMDEFKEQATRAKNGTWTEWTGIWSAYFRPLLAQAMVGEASVAGGHGRRRRQVARVPPAAARQLSGAPDEGRGGQGRARASRASVTPLGERRRALRRAASRSGCCRRSRSCWCSRSTRSRTPCGPACTR